MRYQSLSKSDRSLLSSGARSLDHNEVLIDNSVRGESSHGGNRLSSNVELGRSSVVLSSFSNLEDLLVDFRSVMESVLSSSGYSEGNSGRMPSSNTGDLSKSLVRLSRKSSGSPSRGNSRKSVSFVGGQCIDLLVLLENGIDGNLLFEKLVSEINLLLDSSSVDLNLHEVSLLLREDSLFDLRVSEDSNNGASDFKGLEGLGNGVLLLGNILSVLGESFSLGSVPGSIESSLDRVAQVRCPGGSNLLESLRSLLVSNNSDNDHRGSFDDSNSLDDFLLVNLRSDFVDLSNNVSASGLVSDKSSEMNGLGGIILGEFSDLSSVVFRSLSR